MFWLRNKKIKFSLRTLNLRCLFKKVSNFGKKLDHSALIGSNMVPHEDLFSLFINL